MTPCFDFDGTLMDLDVNWKDLKSAVIAELEKLNMPTSPHFTVNANSLLKLNMYQKLAQPYEMPNANPNVTGVNWDLVNELVSNANSLIISNNLTDTIEKALMINDITIEKDRIYGIDRLGVGKPNLGCIRTILSDHNLSAVEIVYYGDRQSDREFAQKCGMNFKYVDNFRE
jgi:phosphoglycolate phosphatase-like HAD superfamily hydrolase